MPAYTTRTKTVGSVTYVGQAAVGSAETAAVWRIKRITDTAGDLKIEFVDGNAEWDSKWSDVLTYAYS